MLCCGYLHTADFTHILQVTSLALGQIYLQIKSLQIIWSSDCCRFHWRIPRDQLCKDHSLYASSQWEMALHCNAIFHERWRYTAGINLVVRTAQFAHDNPKLCRNTRVGWNFLRSMLPAENAQLFDQWCDIQNPARKLRNSVFSKHLPPLSTQTFPVAHAQYEFSEKLYMCLLRALWMKAVALEHAQPVSRQLHSLIRRRLPLWRIQRMLCIESMNSLVCHAGRLRSTVLMTSYKIVHMSPSKREAWSSKQPTVLHITSYFLRKDRNKHWCLHSQGTIT